MAVGDCDLWPICLRHILSGPSKQVLGNRDFDRILQLMSDCLCGNRDRAETHSKSTRDQRNQTSLAYTDAIRIFSLRLTISRNGRYRCGYLECGVSVYTSGLVIRPYLAAYRGGWFVGWPSRAADLYGLACFRSPAVDGWLSASDAACRGRARTRGGSS